MFSHFACLTLTHVLGWVVTVRYVYDDCSWVTRLLTRAFLALIFVQLEIRRYMIGSIRIGCATHPRIIGSNDEFPFNAFR